MDQQQTAPTGGQRGGILHLAGFLLLFFLVWTVRALAFDRMDGAITSPLSRSIFSTLIKFLLWVVPAVDYAIWIGKVPPAERLGISVMPGRVGWGWCLLATIGYLVMVALIEMIPGRKSFSMAHLESMGGTLVLLQLGFSPLIEEILFRGLVLGELLTLGVGKGWAVLVTSLLFLGTHLPYWLSHEGLTRGMLANAVGVSIFSVVACGLFLKSRSIWPPTVAHIANNLLSTILMA